MLGAITVKLAGADLRGISSWFALQGGAGDIYLEIAVNDT
jgi:hypothetical protein